MTRMPLMTSLNTLIRSSAHFVKPRLILKSVMATMKVKGAATMMHAKPMKALHSRTSYKSTKEATMKIGAAHRL